MEELFFVKEERSFINPVFFSKRPYGWQVTVVKRTLER